MSCRLSSEGLTGAVRSTAASSSGITTGAAILKNAADGEPTTADSRVRVGLVAKTVLAMGTALSRNWSALAQYRRGALAARDDVRESVICWSRGLAWKIFAFPGIQPQGSSGHATAGCFSFCFFTHHSAETTGKPARIFKHRQPSARNGDRKGKWHALGTISRQSFLLPLCMKQSTFESTTQAGERSDFRLAMELFENGVSHNSIPLSLRQPSSSSPPRPIWVALYFSCWGTSRSTDARLSHRRYLPRLECRSGRKRRTRGCRSGTVWHSPSMIARKRGAHVIPALRQGSVPCSACKRRSAKHRLSLLTRQ
jgi:hypothetical protein